MATIHRCVPGADGLRWDGVALRAYGPDNSAALHASRQIRAVVGGVIASVIADTAVYVSSGTRHQGPPGGGPVAAVVRVE